MARGPLAFKQTDVVRAIKAVQAAGLTVTRTEIHTDGRIVLYHSDEQTEADREETFEEWWARNKEPEPEADNGRLLTAEAIAERWSCSPRHVRRLMTSGELPAFRAGPKILRANEADVRAYEVKAAKAPEATVPVQRQRLKRLDLKERRPRRGNHPPYP